MTYSKVKTFTNTAAANSAVVITVPAISDYKRIIRRIIVSFDVAPGAGAPAPLTIVSDGDTLFEVDIADIGFGNIDFGVPGFPGKDGKSVVITLGATAGSVGHLNVIADNS